MGSEVRTGAPIRLRLERRILSTEAPSPGEVRIKVEHTLVLEFAGGVEIDPDALNPGLVNDTMVEVEPGSDRGPATIAIGGSLMLTAPAGTCFEGPSSEDGLLPSGGASEED